MNQPITIRLPIAYGRDASERLDYPIYEGMTEVRRTRRYIWLRMRLEAAVDMLSDANFYAHKHGPDAITTGLKASAIAAVRVIQQALNSNGPVVIREAKTQEQINSEQRDS